MTICPYDTYLHKFTGISAFSLKKIVSVPFTRPDVPCARRPSLLPYDFIQRARYLGFPMSYLYSMSSPVSLFMTAARNYVGYCRHEIFLPQTLCWFISILESIASWVHVWKAFLILVFWSGRFLSLLIGLVYSTFGGCAASTLVGLVASASPRPSHFMFCLPSGERNTAMPP